MVSLSLTSWRKEDEGTEDLELGRFGSNAFLTSPESLCELVPYSFLTNADGVTHLTGLRKELERIQSGVCSTIGT